MPASRASSATVSTSHCSSRLRGLLDDVGASAALGHPLGQEQGHDGTAHAEQAAEYQQRLQVEVDAVGGEDALEAEQREYGADEHQHGEVGRQEQQYSHHRFLREPFLLPFTHRSGACPNSSCGGSQTAAARIRFRPLTP
jgi:hypothetical protein